MSKPHRQRTALPLLILGIGILVLGSCGGDNLVRPTEGTLQISTTTTGSDIDPDGYILTVDSRPDQDIDIRETLVISNLEPGDHNVALTGVIQNCAVGAAERTVTVIAGDTVDVNFRITCESIVPPAPPGGGGPVL
jgi:hypothetical protein